MATLTPPVPSLTSCRITQLADAAGVAVHHAGAISLVRRRPREPQHETEQPLVPPEHVPRELCAGDPRLTGNLQLAAQGGGGGGGECLTLR